MTGAAVAVTGEATSSLSAAWYQINTDARRIIDPDTAVTVYDNGVAQADSDMKINFLRGQVMKISGNFVGPVTLDYSYLPVFTVAEARSFEITFQRELLDVTVMQTSTGGSTTPARARAAALRNVFGSIGSLDNLLTDIDSGGGTVVPFTDWGAGTRRVITLTLSGETEANIKVFAKFKGIKQGMSVDSLLESTLEWELDAPTGTDQTEGAYAFLASQILGFAP
jgi:hypothetical protein